MPGQTTMPIYSQSDTDVSDPVRNKAVVQEYILSLGNRRATLETVGGKGASLAQLLRAGMPVPGGFHVTTAAYERFVAENNLNSPSYADPSGPSTLLRTLPGKGVRS